MGVFICITLFIGIVKLLGHNKGYMSRVFTFIIYKALEYDPGYVNYTLFDGV